MVDYIFGNYLVECGRISKSKLYDILQKQDSARAKIGLIAVSEDLMTLEQAEEVNRLQAIMDKRFGDIAVDKGYLTEGQVFELLKLQGNVWLSFVQALIDENVVSMEEFEWVLYDFKVANGYSDEDLEDLKSDDVDRIVPLLLPKEAEKFKDLICTVVRVMVRLVDRHVYVGRGAMVEGLPIEDMASQSLEGNGGYIDCFAERDGGLLKACSIFGQEDFPRLNMDALDAAGELLNCVNGMYASACSKEGRVLELMPPEYCMNAGPSVYEESGEDCVCRIPIFVGNKGLYFAVRDLG